LDADNNLIDSQAEDDDEEEDENEENVSDTTDDLPKNSWKKSIVDF